MFFVSAALRITGSGTNAKGLYQVIRVAPNENDTYIVSGWGAAYAVNKSFHKDLKFEIAVRVTYSVSDGTTAWQYKDSAVFNTTVANWQYASSAFCLKYKKTDSSDTKTYTPTHILVMPRYNYQANYAYFDHIQLIKDVASSYIYDSEGNVTSVSANAQQKNNMTYDGEDLKTYTDVAGQTTSYTYDAKHRLTQVKSPKQVKQNYTYNSAGQVTAVETESVGGTAKIRSSTTYTDTYSSYGLGAGAYVYKTTNELGKTTTYGHYLATGAPSSVTDANGNKTTYTYTDDKQTKLQQILSGSTSVVYDYDGNKVDSISLGYGTNNTYNETYSFDYDDFGNVKKTFVGSTALVENEYGSNNGLLHTSTYGNGDAIRYKYHYLGLVTDIYNDDDQEAVYSTFGFGYSSNGTPTHYADGPTGTRYDYNYDSIGRLIRTNISNSKTFDYKGSTEYGYDLRNNLTSITNDIGGVSFTQLYGYGATSVAGSDLNAKDNLPTIYTVLDVPTNYHYDGLNRLTKREVGISSNPITNSYTYKMNGTLYTNQLATEDIEGTKYAYEYDNVGNITGVTRKIGSASVTPYRSYTYDGLNRMTSETNGISNFTSTYTYNHLGNITQKVNTLSGANHSKIAYTYSKDADAGWNYLLTKLTFTDYTNNTTTTQTIDYDAIGNPTTYRGATLSWYGRQLTQYVKNGVTSKFTYDADGLRSTKTVAGSKTEYQYVGDKLFYEKRGDGNSFYYFYDSYGKLSAIYHYVNGTRVPYHVVTNAQGDVMALYNWSGTKVAEYSYDAWGNCTILSDSTSTKIATLNPFRYRSYYYDSDLGLYYLQSRYYDAEIGRFINSDNVTDPGAGLMGFNTYVYCGNNPVNTSDPSGHSILGALLGASVISSILADLGSALVVAGCVGLGVTLGVGIGVAVDSARQTYNFKTDAATEADEKIKDTIKPDSPDRYWKADRGTDKIVRISEAISFEEAVTEVSAGRSVFAVTQAEAYQVAFVAGGNVEPVSPEIHGNGKIGYYYHYHTNDHGKAHVWYLF